MKSLQGYYNRKRIARSAGQPSVKCKVWWILPLKDGVLERRVAAVQERGAFIYDVIRFLHRSFC